MNIRIARWSRPLIVATALSFTPAFAQNTPDAKLQADVQHQLNKKQFRDVHAQVSNGAVTLTGSVKVLADKLDAVKRVDKTREASSIKDQITVATEGVSDQELYNKLGKGLAYVRQGYASFPFNSITLQVRDGVAAIGGVVVEPVDKQDAIGLVANTPGVRGLVDNLKVAPLSPMDWSIRRNMYAAVYGSPVATKYAIDPGKPIRIVVVNGHVTLTGVVLNKGDKDIIGQRANGVPGVFSVTNDLQVAGARAESGS